MAKKSKYIDDETIYEMLKPYAYKVVKDLAAQSYRVIDEYYSYDYPRFPSIYKRTFGMKNLFRERMIKIKNGYRVEFEYSANFLTTEHRSNEAVFTGSFVYGWHGGEYAWGHKKPFVPRMNPSPWRKLELYVKHYKI